VSGVGAVLLGQGAGGGSLAVALSAYSTYKFSINVYEVTSDAIVATPSGGTGPYTYEWQHASGSVEITPDAPTAASTTFTADFDYLGQYYTSSYVCKATDSLGAFGYSAPVSVNLACYSVSIPSYFPPF